MDSSTTNESCSVIASVPREPEVLVVTPAVGAELHGQTDVDSARFGSPAGPWHRLGRCPSLSSRSWVVARSTFDLCTAHSRVRGQRRASRTNVGSGLQRIDTATPEIQSANASFQIVPNCRHGLAWTARLETSTCFGLVGRQPRAVETTDTLRAAPRGTRSDPMVVDESSQFDRRDSIRV